MNVERTHTRPHTNRRDPIHGVPLERSPPASVDRVICPGITNSIKRGADHRDPGADHSLRETRDGSVRAGGQQPRLSGVDSKGRRVAGRFRVLGRRGGASEPHSAPKVSASGRRRRVRRVTIRRSGAHAAPALRPGRAVTAQVLGSASGAGEMPPTRCGSCPSSRRRCLARLGARCTRSRRCLSRAPERRRG